MPDRFESGTPNMPGVYGWEAALRWIEETGLETLEKHEKNLTKRFIDGLSELKNVELYGINGAEGRVGVPFPSALKAATTPRQPGGSRASTAC